MANYREIVTKAVIAKGKKLFTTESSVTVNNKPSTILGCWVINHNFNGVKTGDTIKITGSYDVNIWYSSDNDTKTLVVTDTNTYHEVINMREHEEGVDEEIIVRSLRQPSCIKADIEGDNITYTIEKELGIELVGDIKVKIEANLEEDPWDEIEDTSNDNVNNSESSSNIDDIDENFIEEETI